MEELYTSDLSTETVLPNSNSRKIYPAWLLSLLLLAFALRILLLEEQSIWWDEGISLHLAVSSIADILADRLSNIHPPLYFILLKEWLSLVGISAFSARYLSVLASWLQVVVIYGIARRWFSRRTAATAILLATFSAVSILYGQEIRVYAMLAMIYLLLLAVTRELTRPADSGGKRRMRLWMALGLIMWLGLHLHYIVLFVAAYVSAWALLVFIWQRRWVDFRRWLLVLCLVGLASLPWFLAVWRNWATVQSEAVAGTFGTDPAPISFLLSQVWVFHLTGLAGALARPGVGMLAGISAVVLLLLVILRLGQRGTRHDTAILLAHWLIPLSSALVVWTIRSFSHPRYVSMFVPGLILLVAYVVFPPKDRIGRHLKWLAKLSSMILFLGIILSSLLGLWLYFVVPEVAKDDVRGVARYLEDKAEAGDLILIPDTDWSLPFEYKGEASLSMPGLDDPESKWANLETLTTDIRRVFLVDYQHGTRDWQGMLPFALGKAGSMISEREFDGLVVQSYHLDEKISTPEMRSEQADFGPLELTGSWVEQDEPAGGALTLALNWKLSEPMDENAQISLRLVDEAGWSLATEDALLVDENGRPSHQWPISKPVTTYHVISVPPAVPPLAYDLEAQVYVASGSEFEPLNLLDDQGAPEGRTYSIGKTHVSYNQDAQSSNQEDLPVFPWVQPVQMAPTLALLSAEFATDSALPGQTLSVQLLWQATAERMPDLRPEVALVQGDHNLVVNNEVPVYGRYPTNIWSSGEQVFERRNLLVPLDAGGDAKVVLRLGNDEFVLAEVEIKTKDHSFVQPSTDYRYPEGIIFGELAQITGFDLQQTTFAEGEPILLTLVWQSLVDGSMTDYVVFSHLLAEDGHLVAQHDSPPANGNQPTTGWLAGEYISDVHEMSFNETGYLGQARIEVGFYDPVTGDRLLLSDGSDNLILPVTVTIE
jgi:4-amino-4-deoxy-L-arabinose transferase-like glycosyltransferase